MKSLKIVETYAPRVHHVRGGGPDELGEDFFVILGRVSHAILLNALRKRIGLPSFAPHCLFLRPY